MSTSSDDQGACGTATSSEKKYKGVRRRKWGKWVSEIRVPGTPERLWLGSYATAEAAAVAHDVAYYCLRGDSSPQNLNFPAILPAGARVGLSPRSVQKAASDAGMAVDARLVDNWRSEKKEDKSMEEQNRTWHYQETDGLGMGGSTSNWFRQTHEEENLNISVEDYL